MRSFYIENITTQDGLIHQGIFYEPKKHSKVAFLYIHGLTGRFYGDMKIIEPLCELGEKKGFAVASFNNRGHDLIVSIRSSVANGKSRSHKIIGSGKEHFEDSIFDIKAGVDFLEEKGFSQIILVGISTGANKACYYQATQKDKRIRAVVLASPLSDRLSAYKDKKEMQKKVLLMKKLIQQGKGDDLYLDYYYPITPKRYLSLHEKGSKEDCFDYGGPKPKD